MSFTKTACKRLQLLHFEVWLVLLWPAVIIAVNPVGNFPLDDDWAYARSVWALLQEGKFTIDDWPGMTLIAQVLWGSLFCKVFGLSFTVLRISTLIAALFGVAAFYRLARVLGVSKLVAALGSLTVLFSPFYFSLSFTYMTEVPFAACFLWSIYFYSKYLRHNKTLYILLAALLSFVATMIRQPGVLVPLAFLVPVIYNRKNLTSVLIAIIPVALTLGALYAHTKWLQQLGTPFQVGNLAGLIQIIAHPDIIKAVNRFSLSLLYCGIVLSPLLFLLVRQFVREVVPSAYLSIPLVVLLLAILRQGAKIFPGGNILYNCGLGPKLLRDTFWQQNINPAVPDPYWGYLLKILGFSSVAFLFVLFLNKILKNRKIFKPEYWDSNRLIKAGIALSAAGYLGFLVVNTTYYDRYCVPLFLLTGLLLLTFVQKFSKPEFILSCLFLFLVSAFSIGATHDYLSWNRARWQALDYLTIKKKISPSDIDGGFEFNSWYKTGRGEPALVNGKSPWYKGESRFVISFGNISGFKMQAGFYYPQWLTTASDSIYVLEN